jgi:LacI family transcriptional regulator
MTTIYDVAKRVNLSVKTVSRVINNESNVRINTRQKVLHAIEDLDYCPSIAARTIVTKKSGLVGLITSALTSASATPDEAGLSAVDMVMGIQSIIESAGKTLIISDTGGNTGNIVKLCQTYREHRIEGIIYLAEFRKKLNMPRSFKRFPSILINCYDSSSEVPSVVPDDEKCGYLMAKAAFKSGHRRLGFLTHSKNVLAGKLRPEGFKRAHLEMGFDFEEDLIVEGYKFGLNLEKESKHEFLKNALEKLLNRPNPPTIICCSNDLMAIKIYEFFRQYGLKIPEDISVIAGSNYTKISQLLEPSLTTIEIPYFEVGSKGAEYLIKIIEGELVPEMHNQVFHENEILKNSISGKVVWRNSIKEI